MTDGSFFDTNILVYLGSASGPKANRAEGLVTLGGAISVQVLNEFVSVARGKLGWSWGDIRRFLPDALIPLQVHDLTRATHELAVGLAEQHRVHIYDAMIIASALEASCDTLYSEDMHNGTLVEGKLRIVNPFLDL